MKVTRKETVLLLRLVVLLVIAETSQQLDNSESPSSWAKLEISPNTLGSMDYGNFGIKIYEHTSNRKQNTSLGYCKYYFAPIALLDHESAASSFNNVTKQPEMRFRIEMWNPTLKNEVIKYLSKVLRHHIYEEQVQLIPIEEVILTSTSSSSSFSLSSEWKTIHKHQHIIFTLSCIAQDDCDRLATEMRSNPEQFDHFKLIFSLTSQTSQIRQMDIRIESVTSGKLVSNLLQKFDANQTEVYLTAEDEKRMLTETATNIRMETFDDSPDVVSSISEKEIYKILRELLKTSKTTIQNSSDKMWESVFWNDDNYRPDKATKKLNEEYKTMTKEEQKKLAESYVNTNKVGVSTSVRLPKIRVAGTVDTDFSRQGSNSNEELSKLYKESKDHVEWNGEEFVPKPMELFRINLAKFRDSQSFQDRKVRVSYTTAILTAPINFVRHSDLTITDEWQSLKFAVRDLEKLLNARTRDIVDIGKIPTSCRDLYQIGHFKSGLYSVMGTKTVETVYCNFFSVGEDMQKWIGYDNIKSLPTYFHVQRNSPFSIKNIPIPFHIEKLNVGNAMDLKSGKFTAPRAGTYYFSFTGVAQFSKSSTLLQFGISLYLNGHRIGMGWVEEANTANHQSSPLAVQTTANLKPGDQVWVQIWAMSTGVSLFECSDYYFTHFTGWVLEEDIVSSLL